MFIFSAFKIANFHDSCNTVIVGQGLHEPSIKKITVSHVSSLFGQQNRILVHGSPGIPGPLTDTPISSYLL